MVSSEREFTSSAILNISQNSCLDIYLHAGSIMLLAVSRLLIPTSLASVLGWGQSLLCCIRIDFGCQILSLFWCQTLLCDLLSYLCTKDMELLTSAYSAISNS